MKHGKESRPRDGLQTGGRFLRQLPKDKSQLRRFAIRAEGFPFYRLGIIASRPEANLLLIIRDFTQCVLL